MPANTVPPPDKLASDVEEIAKLEAELAGKPAKTFFTFIRSVLEPGKLDTKTKELIAVALGLMARCTWCIAHHTKKALEAGASPEEIREAGWVAVLMCGGPCFTYLRVLEECLQAFTSEADTGQK